MNVRLSGGGVIVGPDKKRIVLVHQHSNTWSLPKGGVEDGESVREAAEREIFEETGISDLTYVEELGTYERYSIGKDGVSENREFPLGRRTFFLFTTTQSDFHPTDGEIRDARWVTIDQAIELLTHPKDKAFVVEVRSRIEAHLT